MSHLPNTSSASGSHPESEEALSLTSAMRDARLTCSLFCALLAIALAGIYVLARPAPMREWSSVLSVLSLSLFLLLLPQGYREFHYFLKRPCPPDLALDAGILLASLAFLSGVGWITPWLPFSLLPLFSVIGLGLFGLCLGQFLKRPFQQARKWSYLVVAGIATTFYLYHGWLVWGSCCLFPRFEQRLLAGGFYIDTIFHSDIVAMFQTYDVFTLGINGISHLPYHVGSHWLFACLAQLLKISPVHFYNLAYPVLIVPILFRSLLSFSLDTRLQYGGAAQRWDLRQDWCFWGLLLIGFVGFLPSRYLDLNAIILSESHLMATSLAFLALSLGLLIKQRIDASSSLDRVTMLLTVIVSILLPAVTITKVSAGYLLFCTAAYFFFRLRLYRHYWLLFCLGLAIALEILALNFMAYIGGTSPYSNPWLLFGYFGRMARSRLPFYLLGVFVWSISYSVLRLKNKNITVGKAFINALQQRQLLDLEAIALLCGLGFLPGFLILMTGISVQYFVDFQMWFSLSLILGNLEQFKSLYAQPHQA